MEKNYISMVREVEKLRAELTNATKLDRSGTNAFGMVSSSLILSHVTDVVLVVLMVLI